MSSCPGPLIWYDVGSDTALLECAVPDCDYIVCAGNWNDARHAQTPLLREGLAL